jgi:predicted ferric reductase
MEKLHDQVEIRYERMNTELILNELVSNYSENLVGVFVCGSSNFMNALEFSSQKFNNVFFHRETYEF